MLKAKLIFFSISFLAVHCMERNQPLYEPSKISFIRKVLNSFSWADKFTHLSHESVEHFFAIKTLEYHLKEIAKKYKGDCTLDPITTILQTKQGLLIDINAEGCLRFLITPWHSMQVSTKYIQDTKAFSDEVLSRFPDNGWIKYGDTTFFRITKFYPSQFVKRDALYLPEAEVIKDPMNFRMDNTVKQVWNLLEQYYIQRTQSKN